jgi:diguanylate cyclase (GGDEF)-like protein
VQPGASVGVALYPRHGEDAEALLRHADTAMYRAKARGKQRVTA